MGAKDKALKRYLSEFNVIADIFRLAFGADGLSVDPAKLTDLDSVQVMATQPKAGGKNVKKESSYRERIHDGVATMEAEFGESAVRLVLGVEGQTKVSQAMPLRMLQYEDQTMTFFAERMAVNVRSGAAPGDWFAGWPEGAVLPSPLSVTLYTGAGEWTGPRSLREMQGSIPEALSRRMADIPLNIVTFKDICEHDPDGFLSDIGVVAAYIYHERNSDKLQELIETKEKFRHLSRKGFDVINTHRKLAITMTEDMEEIDMHYAEQEWQRKAVKRGIDEGFKLGKEQGKADERKNNIGIFIDGCRDFGATAEAIVIQLVKRFNLPQEEAAMLVEKRLS